MKIISRFYFILLLFLQTSSCIDPVPPEFDYIDGLVYIDALATTIPGSSYVNISRSSREFGINRSSFVSNANVTFINSTSGAVVDLTEDNELYIPPSTFIADVGETWELRVVLEDGTVYISETETIRKPVSIEDIQVVYDTELRFEEGNGFIPGHSLRVGFNDPAMEENYYFWRYRSFERLVNCRTCFDGILRDDQCIVVNQEGDDSLIKAYYTYACEERCWQIRYSDQISIFDDAFSNGVNTRDLAVAEVPLYTKRNILIELQQLSLTASAFRYYQTLKDIIDNNSGLNAPLPAALVGNILNPDDAEEFVLGRFTAAPSTRNTVFIERFLIEEAALEPILITQPEGPETTAPQVLTAPCEESRLRTSIQPEGWID